MGGQRAFTISFGSRLRKAVSGMADSLSQRGTPRTPFRHERSAHRWMAAMILKPTSGSRTSARNRLAPVGRQRRGRDRGKQ